eukprot:TRINITY_DN11473_c0_g1_i1.p1 TRINITY_DN11473_c0_g1~~TRINITY_DN11473_c0_g1_i1.p1  ORF type:complete len:310 (-),score=43.85 TRINITY_DN11473_c0_g1_i1:1142-2071(-)
MEALSDVLRDLSWLEPAVDFFSLPADVARQIYSRFSLDQLALVELTCKSALHSNALSKYFSELRIEDESILEEENAKYIFALPGVKRIAIQDTPLNSEIVENIVPLTLTALQRLELKNCGVGYCDWIDILRRRGAADSLKELSITWENIKSHWLNPLDELTKFTSLQSFRLIVRSESSESKIVSITAPLNWITHLTIPMDDFQQHGYLKNFQFLSRLVVIAPPGSPTINMFDTLDGSSKKRDWGKTAELCVERMSRFLPSSLKPWNFFLCLRGSFEHNLLTRALTTENFRFATALLRVCPNWNVNVSCS